MTVLIYVGNIIQNRNVANSSGIDQRKCNPIKFISVSGKVIDQIHLEVISKYSK